MPQDILITPKDNVPNISLFGSGNVTSMNMGVYSTYPTSSTSGTTIVFSGIKQSLVLNDDYVGVGTGVPRHQLDVYGTGNFRGNVLFSGAIITSPASDQNTPSIRSNDTTGFAFRGSANNTIGIVTNSSQIATFNSIGFTLGAASVLGWSSTTEGSNWITTNDLILRRDAPNSLGQRNSTSPQMFRVYNTFTNSGNWEGAVLDWQTTANTFRFGTNHGTSGADRAIEFVMGGSGVYRIETNGNHLFRSNGGSIVTGAGYAYSFQSNMNVTWMQITNSGTSVNTHGAFFGLNVDQFDLWNFQGGGIRLYTSTSTGVGQNTFTLSNRGNIKHCPVGQTSGSPIVLEIVAPPISGVPSGDIPDVLFNLGRNILLASGNNQRETSVLIVPPTYSNVATGVITSGVTLRIAGPPAAGSGTTITNQFALVVESGLTSLGGNLSIAGSVTCTARSTFTDFWLNGAVVLGATSIGGLGAKTVTPNYNFAGDGGFFGTYFGLNDGTGFTLRTALFCPKDGVLDVRNSTTPQTFRVSNTFTSTGNFEAFQIKANTTQYELSSAVGATGSNRNILIGHTDSTGNFNPALTINTAGNTVSSGNFSAAKTNAKGYVFGQDTNWGMTYAFGSWVNINVTSSCQYRMASDGSITAYGPANMTILNGHTSNAGWVTVKGNDVNISGNIAGHAVIKGGDHYTVDGSGGSAFIIGGNSNGTNVSNPSGNVVIRAGLGTGSGLGGSIIIQTSPAGPTGQANNAPVNNIVLDSSGLMTISGVRINNISVTGLIDNYTELTYTPAGSITLPLAKNHQTLDLISTTGNPTITLQTPQNSSAGTLIIKQGTTSRTINWGVSTGVLVWLGTQPTWASDPTGCYRVMTWRYNPSLLTTLVAVTESGA